MAEPQLQEILHKTLSQNPEDQKLALEYLEHAKQANFAEFVRQLADVLAAVGAPDFVRQAAGLQLKNSLVSKDDALKSQLAAQWLQLSAEVRAMVKASVRGGEASARAATALQVLRALGTEKTRPSIAAQCVASMGCIELSHGQWADLIATLMRGVTSPDSGETVKESSLEALGYICQDINAQVIGEQANEILTAIVHGMKKQEPSNHVRLAATTALLNSLEFTSANFENDNERHVIMQVVCEATQSADMHVKVAALQCLVKIMSLYYQYMEHYMAPALFPVTIEAMRSTNAEVCLQGIEFWSNVCEEEIELAVEAEEASDQGRPPENVSKFYAKGALQHLIPILTSALTKQDEGDDEDEWNPAKAAGVCLMLLAQCVGDDVVNATLPFITANIGHSDWRSREAAIMAFGSILEGPDPDKLKPLVGQAMPMLMAALKDPQTVVRDTAAWCIGRVCDCCQEVVVQPAVLEPLLPALSAALNQEPRVAANVCWAISSLAAAAYDMAMADGADDSGQPDTYILSSCFSAMAAELLKATDRVDAQSSNLRIAAYEALMELIKNSPKDCYPTVQQTTVTILKKLEQLLALEGSLQSSSDRSQFRDLQSLLCATLQSVLRKMRPEDAPVISDNIMHGLLQIMQRCSGKEGGGVMEDALMATSTLIEVLGEGFAKYMDNFKPYLTAGLRSHAEYQVCQAAVGIVGDLCRALNELVAPFLDELMQLLLEVLHVPNIDKSVKPQVLSAFGDVALAIGQHFSRYFEPVFNTLSQAALAQVEDKDDIDAIDYVNDLREGCLEAYTGIVQGLKTQNGPSSELLSLRAQLEHILRLIEVIATDANRPPESLIAATAGLIGDLVSAYGAAMLPAVEKESISALLARGRRAKGTKAKSLATWATKEIRKLRSAAA